MNTKSYIRYVGFLLAGERLRPLGHVSKDGDTRYAFDLQELIPCGYSITFGVQISCVADAKRATSRLLCDLRMLCSCIA